MVGQIPQPGVLPCQPKSVQKNGVGLLALGSLDRSPPKQGTKYLWSLALGQNRLKLVGFLLGFFLNQPVPEGYPEEFLERNPHVIGCHRPGSRAYLQVVFWSFADRPSHDPTVHGAHVSLAQVRSLPLRRSEKRQLPVFGTHFPPVFSPFAPGAPRVRHPPPSTAVLTSWRLRKRR